MGFATLWTVLITVPLMAAIQFISAKVGLVTGKGLAGVLRQHYSPVVVLPAVLGLAIVNAINAGVDIGAIAAGINVLAPIPIQAMIVPIALLIVALQVWGSYRFIASTFKWLTLALFSYIGAAFLAHPHWPDVLRGTLVPTVRLDSRFLPVLMALFGTTMSPYMWFWQANQEVEERIAIGHKRLWQRRGTTDKELTYAAADVNIGMIFSNVVAYFIILATAATLFKVGKTDIKSAAAAAEALRPFAGDAARLLFAAGLVGAGFLAVPVLTGSGAYAVAEAFKWKHGLDKQPHHAREFYAVIGASTFIGMFVNYIGVNPLDALFWTGVINGFLTPPLLVLLMLVSNNRRIMGERVNGPWLNVLGWVTAGIMFTIAAGLVLTWGRS